MSDWTEAAVDTAIRTAAQGPAARTAGTTTIRVSLDVWEDLTAEQRAILDERGWKVSLSDLIKKARADQKAAAK